MPDISDALDLRGERRLFVMLRLLAEVGQPIDPGALRAAANVAVPVIPAETVLVGGDKQLWSRRIVRGYQALVNAGILTTRQGDWELTAAGRDAVRRAATPEDFWSERRPARRAARTQESAPPKNVILYGPPGTGKTYRTVEQALVCLGVPVTGDRAQMKAVFDQRVRDGHIRFVTFHQALSYEDFVEGIRPGTRDGAITYDVAPGVFKDLAQRAAADPGQPYVLIVDEINRGNVSGIFGELITLIEETKRTGAREALKVTLPYSKQEFGVPQNLFLIGTMNTADRSLAGLDLALRRRFQFIEMPPCPEQLEKVHVPGVDVALFLTRLNERLQSLKGRDFTIGHAFFLELEGDFTVADLRRVVEGKVIPLLQEYFFEDEQQIAQVLGQRGHAANAANLLVRENTPVAGGNPIWRYERSVLDEAAFYRQVIGGATPAVEIVPDDEAA
ncbi:AAA family ATPase [Actinoplanes sp. NPDC049802]|uniref:McrB family protein n=1 Tax=Actinoplanes sp. NPDC049802 TaxID=3154742 RepID=UPI0033C134EB